MGGQRPLRVPGLASLLCLAACSTRLEGLLPPQLGLGLEAGRSADPEGDADERSLALPDPDAPGASASAPPEQVLGEPVPAASAPEPDAPVTARPEEADAPRDDRAARGALDLPRPVDSPSEPVAPASPAAPPPLRAHDLVGVPLFAVAPDGAAAERPVARIADVVIDAAGDPCVRLQAVREGAEAGPRATIAADGVLEWSAERVLLSAPAAGALASALREAAALELFGAQELETFEGELVSGPEAPPGDPLASITLVDGNNHRHRVVLAPSEVIAGAPLAGKARVRVEGLSMRDDQGPFEVAARLTVGGFVKELRDAAGRPTWARESEARELIPASRLAGREVLVEGVAVGVLAGIELRAGALEAADVALGGDRLLRVPWSALRVGPASLEVDPASWRAAEKGARDAAPQDDAPR